MGFGPGLPVRTIFANGLGYAIIAAVVVPSGLRGDGPIRNPRRVRLQNNNIIIAKRQHRRSIKIV